MMDDVLVGEGVRWMMNDVLFERRERWMNDWWLMKDKEKSEKEKKSVFLFN